MMNVSVEDGPEGQLSDSAATWTFNGPAQALSQG